MSLAITECRYCSRPAAEKVDGDHLCKEHVKNRSRDNIDTGDE